MIEIGRRAIVQAAGGLAVVAIAKRSRAAVGPARVGWLGWTGASGSSPSPVALEAFRFGLAERGWQESGNLVVIVRSGEGAQARDLATELLRSNVDVIVAQGPMVFGARGVAASIPLVFSIIGDPVEAGLVTSLSRPEANRTGGRLCRRRK